MALTLWNLFETSLLCLNAFTIMNETKFKSINEASKARSKLEYGVPVIFLNILTILLKLILGS
ncbi:hypothetical protein NQ317_007192 [Molorchus minor]|uniref:Uncharacterized protein n=1 Tax=Molorchus minor TaxID=1323400 RepID=A0ABQ9J699_9CUCU|nr:hypothetical protein NQ317_007192 [Molorchus minor]